MLRPYLTTANQAWLCRLYFSLKLQPGASIPWPVCHLVSLSLHFQRLSLFCFLPKSGIIAQYLSIEDFQKRVFIRYGYSVFASLAKFITQCFQSSNSPPLLKTNDVSNQLITTFNHHASYKQVCTYENRFVKIS